MEKNEKSGFNEKANQGLNLLMRLKTKFGLVKGNNSYLYILGLERKRDKD